MAFLVQAVANIQVAPLSTSEPTLTKGRKISLAGGGGGFLVSSHPSPVKILCCVSRDNGRAAALKSVAGELGK